MVKRPSWQHYPDDWLADAGLRASSLAARGLWADMLCYLHQGEPYGHLRRNGRDISAPELARMVGAASAVVSRLLKELEDHNVFSRTEAGTIYSRRQVRDENFRAMRAERGREGGPKGGSKAFENPNASRPGDRRKGGRPSSCKGVPEPPLEPPPSSSSSTDLTDYPPTPPAGAGGSHPPGPKPEDAVKRLVERARAGGLSLTLACVRLMRRELKAGVRTEESIAEDLDAQAGAFREADAGERDRLEALEWIQAQGGTHEAAAVLALWLSAHQEAGESRLEAGHRWRDEASVPPYALSVILPYATPTKPPKRSQDPAEISRADAVPAPAHPAPSGGA